MKMLRRLSGTPSTAKSLRGGCTESGSSQPDNGDANVINTTIEVESFQGRGLHTVSQGTSCRASERNLDLDAERCINCTLPNPPNTATTRLFFFFFTTSGCRVPRQIPILTTQSRQRCR
mmetsp:Transcript_36970/g.96874  ORF Transcript_36970/g.96874 Transcript_36970/m.96874 type:complete len:119 (+) Transcript_36970:708-1064(+)